MYLYGYIQTENKERINQNEQIITTDKHVKLLLFALHVVCFPHHEYPLWLSR